MAGIIIYKKKVNQEIQRKEICKLKVAGLKLKNCDAANKTRNKLSFKCVQLKTAKYVNSYNEETLKVSLRIHCVCLGLCVSLCVCVCVYVSVCVCVCVYV